MVDIISIVGLVAAFASAVGFIPQVIKTWRTKRTRDLSLHMIGLFITSSITWITYGVSKNDVFIIGTNSFIFVLTIILLFFKLKYRGKK
ncbi:MAG: SemiSWEET transporter [Candidatus Aenigmarchaeota archaeon]|nr:SemiSWEET transporter [Candidatus Aenigmarchaeota archaeon]